MKNALDIISFISYSSNTEVSKVSSWGAVKKESLNGLNRAIRVLWNSKEWNFRREIIDKIINSTIFSLPMTKSIIAQNGVTINGLSLQYDNKIPFYDTVQKGMPQKYYIDSQDNIILYPVPDKEYILKLETYGSLPVVGGDNNLKSSFSSADDTLNIPERLEDLFIDCLTYFCNEILNGDPTDEEYQEHSIRQAEVYKLLEKADFGTFDNNDDKGFLMPWQL